MNPVDKLIKEETASFHYWDYLTMKSTPTEPYLMFAELIDNSISSFEKKFGSSEKWPRTLEIVFSINFPNPKYLKKEQLIETGTEELNERYATVHNTYIEYQDNACGMDAEELLKALRLNAQPTNQNVGYNRHGRGLKQCAFHFGTDLSISTNNGKNEIMTKIICSGHNANEDVKFRVFEGSSPFKQEIGTTVKISNLYVDRLFSKSELTGVKRGKSTKSFGIKDTLEHRYESYLESSSLKVSFRFIEYGNEAETFELTMAETKIALVSDVFVAYRKKHSSIAGMDFDDFLTKTKALVKSKISENGELDQNIAAETEKQIFSLVKQCKVDEKTIFRFNVKLKVGSQSINATFWAVPPKNSIYSGVKLFEGKRAITHFGSKGGYKDWHEKRHRGHVTGASNDRFAGEIDIRQIKNVSPASDKSRFDFSPSQKDDLDLAIYTVWKVFNVIEPNARSYEGLQESKKRENVQPIEKSRVQQEVASVIGRSVQFVAALPEEGYSTMSYIYVDDSGNKIDIIIKYSENSRPLDPLGHTFVNSDLNSIETIIFVKHPFWSRVQGTEVLKQVSLAQVALLLSIYWAQSKLKSKGKADFLG